MFGCYSSITIPLSAELGGNIEWHKRKVMNVSEVVNNNDDNNGWSLALMAFIEHCRAKGFEIDSAKPWRELGAEHSAGSSKNQAPDGGPLKGAGRTSPAAMSSNKGAPPCELAPCCLLDVARSTWLQLRVTEIATCCFAFAEWTIVAVKNPKVWQITYTVEARILMQRAQDLSGSYRSVSHRD